MMRTTSKEVHNSLVFTDVNHLIIKHDQIPFVHIKIGILLQRRTNSRISCVVWKLEFLYTQATIVNNTRRSSTGRGENTFWLSAD